MDSKPHPVQYLPSWKSACAAKIHGEIRLMWAEDTSGISRNMACWHSNKEKSFGSQMSTHSQRLEFCPVVVSLLTMWDKKVRGVGSRNVRLDCVPLCGEKQRCRQMHWYEKTTFVTAVASEVSCRVISGPGAARYRAVGLEPKGRREVHAEMGKREARQRAQLQFAIIPAYRWDRIKILGFWLFMVWKDSHTFRLCDDNEYMFACVRACVFNQSIVYVWST